MKIGATFYAADRHTWRSWLLEHYKSEQEIWVIFHRKISGKPNVSYNDAVEEALCFGWIDSIRKSLDELRLAHRFTPRKPGSGYSQTNIERLRRMIAQEKVVDELLDEVRLVLDTPFDFPEDIIDALKVDEVVWRNFKKYSEAYQRIRVAFVHEGRKRDGAFEKRLANLVKKTRANKQYGYGIESYY